MSNTDDTLVLPAANTAPSAMAAARSEVHLHFHTAKQAPAKVAGVGAAPYRKPAPKAAIPAPVIPGGQATQIPPSIFSITPPVERTDTTDAATGIVHTSFTDPTNGSSATLSRDPSQGFKSTLTLKGKDSEVITVSGDAAGFTRTIPQGQTQIAAVQLPTWLSAYLASPTATVSCGGRTQYATPAQAEGAALKKLQDFMEDHPRLAAELRKTNGAHTKLSVTVVGGQPVSLTEALDTPPAFRACPAHEPQVNVETLTRESVRRDTLPR
jgi:hypothetical protein